MRRACRVRTCVLLSVYWLINAAVHAETAVRILPRVFPTETRLARDGKPGVLIVHGAAHRPQAEALRAGLRDLCKVDIPLMLDTEATAGTLWTLRPEVQSATSSSWGTSTRTAGCWLCTPSSWRPAQARLPGSGRYVLRHLAEPFTRGHAALVIGASDVAGLERGITRLLDLLRSGTAEFAIGFPFLEFGDADGPIQIADDGATFRDFRDAAYVFYSGGRAPARYSCFGPRSVQAALRAARELLLAELAKDAPGLDVGDHYQFIPNYQALRLIVAHGLLSAKELRRFEEKLVDNALAHPDSYAVKGRKGEAYIFRRKWG